MSALIHDDCYKIVVIQNDKTIREYMVSNTSKDSGFVNRLRQALLYKFPNSEVKIIEVKYSELSYQERIDLQSDYV